MIYNIFSSVNTWQKQIMIYKIFSVNTWQKQIMIYKIFSPVNTWLIWTKLDLHHHHYVMYPLTPPTNQHGCFYSKYNITLDKGVSDFLLIAYI
jgi:hypothetical protein